MNYNVTTNRKDTTVRYYWIPKSDKDNVKH